MYTLKTLNKALSEWLEKDTYFKSRTWSFGLYSELAKKLSELETHLLLWHAKYEVWIPENPSHSLVYLADEKRHGVEFPHGIEELIYKLLKKWWRLVV